MLQFLLVKFHLGTQPTGARTHPSRFSTCKSQQCSCRAECKWSVQKRQNVGCWSCANCCRSTRSVGKGQGTKGRFNHYAQTEALASRAETHCRRTEGTLGQVAEGTKSRVGFVLTESRSLSGTFQMHRSLHPPNANDLSVSVMAWFRQLRPATQLVRSTGLTLFPCVVKEKIVERCCFEAACM
jgi:hypothetical protein